MRPMVRPRRPPLGFGAVLNRLACASRPLARRVAAGIAALGKASPRTSCRAMAPQVRRPASLALAIPDPEAPAGRQFLLTAPEGRTARAVTSANRKDPYMAKPAPASPRAARVLPPRNKGTTLEMVRLVCPDTAQAQRICESFGLPILDSDGVREAHERLIVETSATFGEGLGERAMQIHLQRIVGAYVASAHGAGQFYSRAVSEARDATAKSANDRRDEDRDGPVGFDSAAQRKREFAADVGVQAHALRMAAEGAVAAYARIVGETWKPFERPLDNSSVSVDRKAAAVQMQAFG